MFFSIKEIDNKEIWEDFFRKCPASAEASAGEGGKTFLQSWNWGEFQKEMGNKIWRLGVFEKENLVGVALISKITAKRGTFLLIQHGPSFAKASADKANNKELLEELLKELLKELKKIGKEEGCSFIRISPLLERNEENKKTLKNLGFIEAPMHANAYESSWKLDINPPEENLLKGMRKTTRYLIRQAQKDENIEIFQRWDISDVEVFNKLHSEVVKVQKFVPFSLDYFKKEFSAFRPDDKITIFFAKYKGEIAAASYVIFWSNIAFYHHAALLPEYHKFPLSYLLQWEAIKEAKKRKCVLYDFWGYINPEKQPKHPWAGPTLFKMGFGGKAYEYVKTQDFPLSKKYWLTYIFENARKIKRGL